MEYLDSIYMEIIQVFKIVELIKIDIGCILQLKLNNISINCS